MKVSIIITAYNYGKYLKKAIESVLNQNFDKNNFEIILINDGSTDNTSEILEQYKNQIIIINQENKGLVESCNKDILISKKLLKFEKIFT